MWVWNSRWWTQTQRDFRPREVAIPISRRALTGANPWFRYEAAKEPRNDDSRTGR
jgi:hypothetical protein